MLSEESPVMHYTLLFSMSDSNKSKSAFKREYLA